jgi:hypothetical protein
MLVVIHPVSLISMGCSTGFFMCGFPVTSPMSVIMSGNHSFGFFHCRGRGNKSNPHSHEP